MNNSPQASVTLDEDGTINNETKYENQHHTQTILYGNEKPKYEQQRKIKNQSIQDEFNEFLQLHQEQEQHEVIKAKAKDQHEHDKIIMLQDVKTIKTEYKPQHEHDQIIIAQSIETIKTEYKDQHEHDLTIEYQDFEAIKEEIDDAYMHEATIKYHAPKARIANTKDTHIQPNVCDKIIEKERLKNIIINAKAESTEFNISLHELGNVEIDIVNTPDHKGSWLSCYSEYNNLYHIKSGQEGCLQINLRYQNIKNQNQATFFIRSVLVKKNTAYREYPVDKLCDKHQTTDDDTINRNPVQAKLMTPLAEYFYTTPNPRSSLIHWCMAPNNEGTIETTTKLMFPCNDTCTNSTYSSKFTNTEASRDLVLVQTLEQLHNDKIQVLARHHIDIWVKAVICNRDLKKTERRKPKGGLAHQINKKRKIEEQNTIEKSEATICKTKLNSIHNIIQNGKIKKQEAQEILIKLDNMRRDIVTLLSQ